MGRLKGKVAFITGAARGQGRSHAVRLAQEGADLIVVDLFGGIDSLPYSLATQADLDETVRQVEELGRRIVATQADVRDTLALKSAVDAGVEQLGKLDIVVANAGILSLGLLEDVTDSMWDEMIGVNLTGVFKTVRAAVPHIRAGGRGGAIVLTSSTAGIKGVFNLTHYSAAKHGVVGLMKTMANELADEMIRVNSVHPTGIDTAMIDNTGNLAPLRPDKAPSEVTLADAGEVFKSLNALPVDFIEPVDVSNAILFLVSDEARYITGVQLPVDAGFIVK